MNDQHETPESNGAAIRSLGFTLLAIALASFLLPMIGVQFRLITLLQRISPNAPLILGGIGAVILAIGAFADRSKE